MNLTSGSAREIRLSPSPVGFFGVVCHIVPIISTEQLNISCDHMSPWTTHEYEKRTILGTRPIQRAKLAISSSGPLRIALLESSVIKSANRSSAVAISTA